MAVTTLKTGSEHSSETSVFLHYTTCPQISQDSFRNFTSRSSHLAFLTDTRHSKLCVSDTREITGICVSCERQRTRKETVVAHINYRPGLWPQKIMNISSQVFGHLVSGFWPSRLRFLAISSQVFPSFPGSLSKCRDGSRQFQVAITCFTCSPPYLNFKVKSS